MLKTEYRDRKRPPGEQDMAFCIQMNVAGMPHRLRDWEREATSQYRFTKPLYLIDRFDWVGPLGVYYTRFRSLAEAETAARTLKVEQPHFVYSIREV
jgi:hypothetical protein